MVSRAVRDATRREDYFGMVRLLYKAGLLTVVASTATAYACYELEVLNSSWFSSLAIVRFGRASYAVSFTVSFSPTVYLHHNISLQAFRVSLDYKWSLHGLDSDSADYRQIMSEVGLS